MPIPPLTPARAPHGSGPASDWILRWSRLFGPGHRILDVASGAGRHSLVFAALGCEVTAIDRDAAALEPLRSRVRTVVADVEGGPWPLPGQTFDAVVVTHYLWRPLWPTLLDSLAPGGWLLAETFVRGHERLGRPSNPAFLLRPGELLDVAKDLHVLAYEDGLMTDPPRRIQRIAAHRVDQIEEAARGDIPLQPPR